MAIPCPKLEPGTPLVVGSAAGTNDLRSEPAERLESSCDIVEVRLDLLDKTSGSPWEHLAELPLLFTARRADEGGSGPLLADERSGLLMTVLEEASLIDIEVASIGEMSALIAELKGRGLPWIASYHDFDKLPEAAIMEHAATRARNAGATAFKLAAHLVDESELERLVDFQKADHGLPTATMGMGTLGAESRVRCAHAGSVLNYGYLGTSPTAPGQLSAAELKKALGQAG